jgi:hypothetical protein
MLWGLGEEPELRLRVEVVLRAKAMTVFHRGEVATSVLLPGVLMEHPEAVEKPVVKIQRLLPMVRKPVAVEAEVEQDLTITAPEAEVAVEAEAMLAVEAEVEAMAMTTLHPEITEERAEPEEQWVR